MLWKVVKVSCLTENTVRNCYMCSNFLILQANFQVLSTSKSADRLLCNWNVGRISVGHGARWPFALAYFYQLTSISVSCTILFILFSVISIFRKTSWRHIRSWKYAKKRKWKPLQSLTITSHFTYPNFTIHRWRDACNSCFGVIVVVMFSSHAFTVEWF